MKLYYASGTCSIGIHILLEEAGRPYEGQRIHFGSQEQQSPQFKAINPKGKIPVLQRDDGSVVTEFQAIALCIARANPDKKLLPTDPEGELRALEALDYIIATLHMQGFTRYFRPENFAPSEADHEAVKARGIEIVEAGFQLFEERLQGRDYVLGAFSAVDAALFFLEFWTDRVGRTLSPNLAAHYARMRGRPTVTAALAAEGLAT